ncbi:MAG TPA: NAD(P)/FAD-dependent oxidoreductase [Myxococcota bacterium]|nr:NAD(P)/FAD-dependent oxidoreductase [Myxococcota bacterium]
MRQPKIAILGAGAGGLCMGMQLHRAGFRDFTIYEKSDRVGGTWHDNTYPGAACDVPSHLYSFSFESKRDWSRKFAPQPEIEAYFQHVAEKWGLLPRTRFGVEATGASFDEASGQWRLRTRSGEEHVADVLVSGLGQLNRPSVPDFSGLASFEGASWHSARWNHGVDVAGQRVAVIGNAASALQFIPKLAPRVERLHVFQRTPNYVVPRSDREFSEREQWAFAHVPGLQRLYRAWIWARLEANFFAFTQGSWLSRVLRKGALQYLEAMVGDPALRAKLTPDYPVGCKRLLISDDYFQALVRPNVELVTDGIQRIEPHAVVTRDGARREVDAIVFATGFDTTHFLAPLEIEGRGGAKLRDVWKDGAEAHLGITVSGFPNLFLLYGPNTNLGHNSILFMIECQVRYAIRCIQELARRDLAWLDVRRDAMDRYNAEVQAALRTTAWNAACGSWYKTESGRITNNWKGFTTEYWWRTRRPDFSAFEARARA